MNNDDDDDDEDNDEQEGEFYSSLVVMGAPGVWCFGLSLYVNAEKEPAEKKGKKDPKKEL